MRPTATVAVLLMGLVLLSGGLAAAADRDGDGLRDAFERKYGVTDPNDPDSDGDGVVDAAEDDDSDRLSNLGEQRFRTNPGKRDTDGDGKLDGAEDRDRDGISNAREQDRRPLPRRLKPSLTRAADDVPSAHATCFVKLRVGTLKRCTFGDPEGDVTLALFGDSHALQWVPAISRAADQEGWRLVTLLKGGCPSTGVATTAQLELDGHRSCRQWRDSAMRWLRRNPPDLVIIANSDGYGMVDGAGNTIRSKPQKLKLWQRGMSQTLKAMPGRSEILVLGETPDMSGDPVQCLRGRRGDISACTARPAPPAKRPFERVERRVAKQQGAQFRTLYGKVCPYDPCPLVQGDVLIWRDRSHITATFARQLAPAMRDLLLEVLQDTGRLTAEPTDQSGMEPTDGAEIMGPPAPLTPWQLLTGAADR